VSSASVLSTADTAHPDIPASPYPMSPLAVQHTVHARDSILRESQGGPDNLTPAHGREHPVDVLQAVDGVRDEGINDPDSLVSKQHRNAGASLLAVRSVWQRLDARTRTRTSPGLGGATMTSSATTAPPRSFSSPPGTIYVCIIPPYRRTTA